jgi:hypothetical protein
MMTLKEDFTLDDLHILPTGRKRLYTRPCWFGGTSNTNIVLSEREGLCVAEIRMSMKECREL